MAGINKRLLFASPHCVVDPASGAAIATFNALELLAKNGCECAAFCASKLDSAKDEKLEQLLADQRLSVRRTHLTIGDGSVHLLGTVRGRVQVTILPTRSTRIEDWDQDEPSAALATFERVVGNFRPDVLLTYGGHPVAQELMKRGSRELAVGSRGSRPAVVFSLHNLAYNDASFFRDVDHVIVPSEFSRRWYRERLGLECHVLPNAIDWSRVGLGDWGLGDGARTRMDQEQNRSTDPQSQTPNPCNFVTFVNPQPAKGLFVFARIAEQIARLRPDIPILVVESRGQASFLEQTNLDLSWADNLHAMENTPDPRDFYRVTKLLLMPSLVPESFGLVAAEAMINGIPVLASNRGALPETLGGSRESAVGSRGRTPNSPSDATAYSLLPTACPSGGFLFDIPERYTPETMIVPSAQEVEPWVETIIRLWDDAALYRECSERARRHAQQWHPDRLGPMYADFFRNVRPQPGPPFAPRGS